MRYINLLLTLTLTVRHASMAVSRRWILWEALTNCSTGTWLVERRANNWFLIAVTLFHSCQYTGITSMYQNIDHDRNSYTPG